MSEKGLEPDIESAPCEWRAGGQREHPPVLGPSRARFCAFWVGFIMCGWLTGACLLASAEVLASGAHVRAFGDQAGTPPSVFG